MNPRIPSTSDTVRVNHRIRAREVRVIGADGGQLGIMDLKRALELAESMGLDLAEVSPNSSPPVCKILDYGKYKYQLKKKAKQSKKNQAVTTLKEIQFRPQTDTHDIEYKVKHILRFLSEGNKVKVSVRFRGREASHANLGHALLKQIIDMVGNSGIVEQTARLDGKVLFLMLAPNAKARKTAKAKEAAAPENEATEKLSGAKVELNNPIGR